MTWNWPGGKLKKEIRTAQLEHPMQKSQGSKEFKAFEELKISEDFPIQDS